jgi:iron complex transport system substrate-binding protein
VTRSPIHGHALSSREIDRLTAEQLHTGGTLYYLDDQRLRALAPDLILTQELCEVCAVAEPEVRRAVRVLDAAPRVLSLEPNTLADVLATIGVVAEATDRVAAGTALVAALETRIARVREAAASLPGRPTVFGLEWTDPPWVGGHWVPEMVELAGGRPLLKAPGAPSVRVDWEAVRAADPEVVVLMPCGFDLARTLNEAPVVRAQPGWDALRAVRDGRVFAVDGSSYFNRPGPRLVDGLELLAHLLHPERFPAPRLPAAFAPFPEA